jgi:hypothetical protein
MIRHMTLTDWSSSHFLRVLGAWIYIEQKGHMVKVHYHCFTQNCPVLQEAEMEVTCICLVNLCWR